MKKPYQGHELVYRKIKKQGLSAWGQKGSGSSGLSDDPQINSFLKDVLSQPWAPKSGRAVELGCGTGPILRRICKKNFYRLGIDISKTAIQMARQLSIGLDIKFKQGDVCNLNTKPLGKFDLAIDGLCLHCITDPKDRKAYLANVFNILKEGGLFLLLSMCAPIDKKRFSLEYKGQRLIKNVIYVPFKDQSYDLVTLSGQTYLPTRCIAPWKDILTELRQAGLTPKLIRFNEHNSEDFCSTLTVGALKNINSF